MKMIILLLIFFQCVLMVEKNKTIEFSSTVYTQCFNYKVEPYLKISFNCDISGFDEPVEYELKFKNFNLFTSQCVILKDDDISSEKSYCIISLVEYGLPFGLKLPDEPPNITDVQIKNWEYAANAILFTICHKDYAYQLYNITDYYVYRNENGKFLYINGIIKKEMNITGEETTELNVNPIIRVDNSPIDEITNCKIIFNATLDEDKNAQMRCNIIHGKQVVFIRIIPLDHNHNFYVNFEISKHILNLEKYSYSSFINFKFWVFIIIFLLF